MKEWKQEWSAINRCRVDAHQGRSSLSLSVTRRSESRSKIIKSGATRPLFPQDAIIGESGTRWMFDGSRINFSQTDVHYSTTRAVESIYRTMAITKSFNPRDYRPTLNEGYRRRKTIRLRLWRECRLIKATSYKFHSVLCFVAIAWHCYRRMHAAQRSNLSRQIIEHQIFFIDELVTIKWKEKKTEEIK